MKGQLNYYKRLLEQSHYNIIVQIMNWNYMMWHNKTIINIIELNFWKVAASLKTTLAPVNWLRQVTQRRRILGVVANLLDKTVMVANLPDFSTLVANLVDTLFQRNRLLQFSSKYVDHFLRFLHESLKGHTSTRYQVHFSSSYLLRGVRGPNVSQKWLPCGAAAAAATKVSASSNLGIVSHKINLFPKFLHYWKALKKLRYTYFSGMSEIWILRVRGPKMVSQKIMDRPVSWK